MCKGISSCPWGIDSIIHCSHCEVRACCLPLHMFRKEESVSKSSLALVPGAIAHGLQG